MRRSCARPWRATRAPPSPSTRSRRGRRAGAAFLEELAAHLCPARRCCTRSSRRRSTPRSTALASARAVLSVAFAAAPDGTPHALSGIRRRCRARAAHASLVPLGRPARIFAAPLFDAYSRAARALGAGRDAGARAVARAAHRERYAGGRRRIVRPLRRVALNPDEDVRLLDRLRGAPRSGRSVASTAGEEERLAQLVELGLVIVR